MRCGNRYRSKRTASSAPSISAISRTMSISLLHGLKDASVHQAPGLWPFGQRHAIFIFMCRAALESIT